MRNSGFVTDSDTERELRKWQQARDMPIDAERIRQQYKNRQNNAKGQHFEQKPQDRRIYRAFQYTRTTRFSRDLIRRSIYHV